MSWLGRLREVLGLGLPADLNGVVPSEEDVLSTARTDSGSHLAVTPLGLWVPESTGHRRIGWHLISKATWSDGVLSVTEASEVGNAGQAVLLADGAAVPWQLERPGDLPRMVRQRVESSIRARHRKELAAGGAWFVLRKVPGSDGVVLQARPDRTADPELVAAIAREAAEVMTPPDE